MSITRKYAARPVPQLLAREVVAPRISKRWVDWVTTTDHKKIGIMYLVLTFVFFMPGRGRGAADAPAAQRAEQHAADLASTTTSC